ncbi:MAG: hypothetical protein ACYC3H_00190 [Bellilinea sp.]
MLSEIDQTMQRMDDLSAQDENWVAQVEPDSPNRRRFGSNGEQTSYSIAVSGAHFCGAEHVVSDEILEGKVPSRDPQAEFAMITSKHNELFHLLHQNSKETREILSSLTPKIWKDLAWLKPKNNQEDGLFCMVLIKHYCI